MKANLYWRQFKKHTEMLGAHKPGWTRETAPCRRANTETDNQMVDLNPEPLLWGISANHHCAALIEKNHFMTLNSLDDV